MEGSTGYLRSKNIEFSPMFVSAAIQWPSQVLTTRRPCSGATGGGVHPPLSLGRWRRHSTARPHRPRTGYSRSEHGAPLLGEQQDERAGGVDQRPAQGRGQDALVHVVGDLVDKGLQVVRGCVVLS